MTFSSSLKTLLIAATLSVGFTGAAFAQDQVFTAKLANPPAARAHVVADNSVWNCEGDTCTSVAHHASTVHDCRLLVRVIGPVSSYGVENAQLSEEDIARCNGTAQTQTAQAH